MPTLESQAKAWLFFIAERYTFRKKQLQSPASRAIIPSVSDGGRRFNIGMSPSGKAPDFDSGIRRFESGHPSQISDPLAQPVEQLPFKQWVRGSSPRRVTKKADNRKVSGFFAFFGYI